MKTIMLLFVVLGLMSSCSTSGNKNRAVASEDIPQKTNLKPDTNMGVNDCMQQCMRRGAPYASCYKLCHGL